MTLSAIDQEQANVKRLSREIAAASPLPSTYVSPKGIYEAVDAIEISSAEKTHQFSPRLPFPDFSHEHFGATLARLQMKFDELSLSSTDLFDEEVEQNQALQDVLKADYQAALDEELQAKNAESNWNALGTAFQYLASIASLAWGAKRYVSGEDDLASVAFLFAAAGLGLGNQLMVDTQSWKTLINYFTESLENRQKIESCLQTTTFLLSTGLALVGLSSAQANLMQRDDVTRIISLAKALIGPSTKLGAMATRKRACDIQASFIRLQADQTDLLKDLELSASSNQEMQRVLQQILSVMKEALKSLQE